MDEKSDKLLRTDLTRPRQISIITKLKTVTKGATKGSVIAWECDSPKKGCHYIAFLLDGMLLKTSLVQDLRETENGLIIETQNSVYQIEYLTEESLESAEKRFDHGQRPNRPDSSTLKHESA